MGGVSHGRGGAGRIPLLPLSPPPFPLSVRVVPLTSALRLGNIYSREHQPSATRTFTTPTIKQDFYTTGRGGSGNMVYNDPHHPEIARESQDVETPPLRVEEAPHHTGRGRSCVIPGF